MNSDNPHIEEVIIAFDTRGSGKSEDDPVRRVLQVFSKDGKLIAENDPFRKEVGGLTPEHQNTLDNLHSFAKNLEPKMNREIAKMQRLSK